MRLDRLAGYAVNERSGVGSLTRAVAASAHGLAAYASCSWIAVTNCLKR